MLNLNLVVDPEDAASLAAKALLLAFEKQGVVAPSALFAQPSDGGGSSGSGSGASSGGRGGGGSNSGASSGDEGGSCSSVGGGSGDGGIGRRAGAAKRQWQRAQHSISAAVQQRVLRRLQAEGGGQLLLLGVMLGSLCMLCLRYSRRLAHWPVLPKR